MADKAGHRPAHSLLPLLQAVVYGDSAYPSGRYTLSHGLEPLVQTGRVSGAAQAAAVLRDALRSAAAPGDGVATACAALIAAGVARPEGSPAPHPSVHPSAIPEAVETLVTLDRELSATKVTEELRRASTRVGRQTLTVHRALRGSDVTGPERPREPTVLLEGYAAEVEQRRTPGNQAVVLGLIHAEHGLTPTEAVAVELLGFAVGWSSAALRLRQCDHVSGQAIVSAALTTIAESAEEAVASARELVDSGCWDHLGRASPGLDLASAYHETAPARLFLS